MIDNGKISIIVPMYNCAEFAPKCIDNILSQSYTNWELWLVHGDSNDGTESVCQSYEDKDSRIHNIFHIDGLVPARNVGYEHATGDWIMYIDGDDWIDGDCLVEIMEAAVKYNNPDVVFWKFVQDLGNRVVEGKWHFNDKFKEKLYVGDECKDLACEAMDYKHGIGESYAKIAKRSYCRKYNLHQNSLLRQGLEGWEYSLRLFYLADKVLYLNKYYNHYRYNPNSLSKVISENNAMYSRDSLVEIHKFIAQMSKDDGDRFTKKIYERTQYVILAIAMSTYFHPNNNLNYKVRCERFQSLINRNDVFLNALNHIDYSIFDKKRAFSLFCLKYQYYSIITIISKIKQYMFKRGLFKY